MQDGINVQDGKSLKINKRAGWNKGVQDGLFQKKNKVCCTIIRYFKVIRVNTVEFVRTLRDSGLL